MMDINKITLLQRIFANGHSQGTGPSHKGHHHISHAHCLQRALSRRQFLQTTAGATGVVLSAGLWLPALARAAQPTPADPNPIPGGVPTGLEPPFDFIHFFPPGPGVEPSLITDFNGFIGVTDFEGTGTGINTGTGDESDLLFAGDVRFMDGEYVGVDGKHYQGTFGFV